MATSGGVQTGGGGVAFPDFTGAGSPEGNQVGAVGESYGDTTNGALYFKASGAGNTGWVGVGGTLVDLDGAVGIAGVGFDSGDSTFIMAKADGEITITDVAAFGGTGNSWYWHNLGSDGTQFLTMQLGSTGQFTWSFDAAGLTGLPGALATVPPDSNTVTAAFAGLVVDTPFASLVSFDVLVSGTIRVTAATAGTLKVGVAAGATPTTDPIIAALTTATPVIVPFSVIVPAGFHISIVSGGTITFDPAVIVVTAI